MRTGIKYFLAGLACWCLTLGGVSLVYASSSSHGEELAKPAASHGEVEKGHGETKPEHGEAKSEDGEEVEGEDHAPKEMFEISYEPLPQGRNQPWRLIRKIQSLQDKIARGGENSLQHYRAALVRASQLMLADHSEKTWAHERNVTAVATYLLIGGNPVVGAHAFRESSLSAAQKLPLAAALAYVERRYIRANRLLEEIVTERLPSTAKGQFALVKAMVTSSAETKKATHHLEQARRFAPGTLTEEAALRRLIRIAGAQVDTKKGAELLLRYASAYFRHFSRSIYATDFLRNYGFSVVRTLDEMGPKALTHLKSFLPKLLKKHQVFLIAIVARNAVVLGKIKLGSWASNWLLANVDSDDKLHARIELYQIATSILDPESYAEAAVQLDKLSSDILGKQDKRLYLALRKLSSRIGSQPVNVERLKELSRIENQSFPGDEPELPFDVEQETKLAATNPILVRTRNLFSRADELLGK